MGLQKANLIVCLLLKNKIDYSNSQNNYLGNSVVKRQSSTTLLSSSNSSFQNQMATNVEPLTAGSLAAATVDLRKAAVLQEVMNVTGSQSVLVAVDKIFTGSIRLDGDAIVEFVKALAQASLNANLKILFLDLKKIYIYII